MCSAQTSKRRGDALFTLGLAYVTLGNGRLAAEAGRRAIAAGVSSGHLVLAELAEKDEDVDVNARRKRSAQHRRKVDEHDRERFFGPAPKASTVAADVWRKQREKSTELGRKLRDSFADDPPPDALGPMPQEVQTDV